MMGTGHAKQDVISAQDLGHLDASAEQEVVGWKGVRVGAQQALNLGGLPPFPQKLFGGCSWETPNQ